jgi:sugar lactone lactonase YvrE
VQPDRTVTTLATLPPSVAAFHVAIGPDDCVYVTGPTLGAYDSIYRVDPDSGSIEKVYSGFGRPQGIAFDSQGALYVVEALAGWNGLYRVRQDGSTELIVAGQSLVGVAFNPHGGLAVASNDTVYRLDVGIRPLR